MGCKGLRPTPPLLITRAQGFGNNDEAEDAAPDNFNMNTNDGAAIDDELVSTAALAGAPSPRHGRTDW